MSKPQSTLAKPDYPSEPPPKNCPKCGNLWTVSASEVSIGLVLYQCNCQGDQSPLDAKKEPRDPTYGCGHAMSLYVKPKIDLAAVSQVTTAEVSGSK